MANPLFDLGYELLVPREQQVRRKDGRVLITQSFPGELLVERDFLTGGIQSGVKPRQFDANDVRRNQLLRNPKTFGSKDHRRSDGHTRRDGDSAFDQHAATFAFRTA